MSIIIPKLGLHDIHDGDLVEYALDKVTKVGGNAAYAAISPSPAQVEAKTNQYEQALIASDDGNKAQTGTKNTRRAELERMLTLQAENCAEIASGDLNLYLTSGYEAKDTVGTPVGELGQVLITKVEATENVGELKTNWQPVPHADNYTARCYTNDNNPAGSIVFTGLYRPSKATISNLPSGAKIYIQVQANGGSTGTGAWSEPVWDRPK
jgi:hypothetical protein